MNYLVKVHVWPGADNDTHLHWPVYNLKEHIRTHHLLAHIQPPDKDTETIFIYNTCSTEGNIVHVCMRTNSMSAYTHWVMND